MKKRIHDCNVLIERSKLSISSLSLSELSDFFDILPLAGGDKPRHYKRSITEQVGAGFIPGRELACIEDDCRWKIAQFSWF